MGPIRLRSLSLVSADTAERYFRFTRPARRLRLHQDPPRPPRPHRQHPAGQQFRPGEPVRQSGIYEVVHASNHREAHEVVMLAGELFPACDTCLDAVHFVLIRTAPYIFQDEDFETQ